MCSTEGATRLTVQVGTPHKRNVHTQISVVRRTIQAKVDTKWHRTPRWVFGAAIEADLIGFLALQLLEDGVRLRFVCQRHYQMKGGKGPKGV